MFTEMLQFLYKRSGATAFISRCRSFSSGVACENGSSSFAVMSFGDGSQGALGLPASLIGVGADAYEPTVVPGLPDDVVSVSAGHYHSLAVSAKGELWAWGRNDEGQLGRGLLEPRFITLSLPYVLHIYFQMHPCSNIVLQFF